MTLIRFLPPLPYIIDQDPTKLSSHNLLFSSLFGSILLSVVDQFSHSCLPIIHFKRALLANGLPLHCSELPCRLLLFYKKKSFALTLLPFFYLRTAYVCWSGDV